MNARIDKQLIKAALIAASYSALCALLQPISFGPVQLRVAEGLSLTVLYTYAAVPGLFIGCLITNLMSPYGLLDIIGGSLTTLIAAVLGYHLRDKGKFLAGLPFVLLNAVIISLIICLQSDMRLFWIQAVSIGAGEIISVWGVGLPMCYVIDKNTKLREFITDKADTARDGQ